MFPAFGHLAAQMLTHILLMSAAAPLLAFAARRYLPLRRVRLIVPATVVQVAVLWAWHSPPALDAAMRSGVLHTVMLLSLLAAAFWFWSAIFDARERRWRAILALLVTGKLFCLLGVLLVFAPRALYAGLASGHAGALADQQLAGLLMLIACPATYVAAGVIVAARWLGRIESGSAPAHARPAA
jgi:putative membrane protein